MGAILDPQQKGEHPLLSLSFPETWRGWRTFPTLREACPFVTLEININIYSFLIVKLDPQERSSHKLSIVAVYFLLDT